MSAATPQPYAEAAARYLALGWNPVPVDPESNRQPHGGLIGYNAPKTLDPEKVRGWIESPKFGAWNVGLRLVRAVSLDVDDPDEFRRVCDELGAPPATFYSTARGASSERRQLFYAVPSGFDSNGLLPHGAGEIADRGHRFARVWPSMHAKTGNRYEWYRPTGSDPLAPGELMDEPPQIDDLPDLPEGMFDWFTGEARDHTAASSASDGDVEAIIEKSRKGSPTRDVSALLEKIDALEHVGNNDTVGLFKHAFGLALGGHAGSRRAIDRVRERAVEYVGTQKGRSVAEVDKAMATAAGSALAEPRPAAFEISDAERKENKRRNKAAKKAKGKRQEPAETDETAPGASWQPHDVSAALQARLEGRVTRPMPTLGLLENSELGLFYPGRVSGLHGESGAGKSWVLWMAMAQELNAGNPVVLIDYEDDLDSAIERLLDLGTQPAAIETLFSYLHPEEPSNLGRSMLAALLDRQMPTLVGIDSTGEGLSQDGVQPNADEEVAEWFRLVPRWIARRGPAVVVLDHSPKASDDRELFPIGSQRKRSAINGAQYLVAQGVAFSREKSGHAMLTCAKDRPGNYSKRQKVARLTVDVTGAAPVFALIAEPATGAGERDEFRPTKLMEDVSRLLESSTGATSLRGVESAVKGRKGFAKKALDVLVAEGFARRDEGARASHLHTSLRPYRQADDPTCDGYVPRPVPLRPFGESA